MFCDLVGSTALAEQLDPEELSEVLRSYQNACSAAIRSAGGHIAQFLGDGILAYFGYPHAHEDDASRAVRAGLGALRAVAELGRRLRQEQGLALAARVAVHTGLVVVGEVGDGVTRERLALGQAPNVAARLEALAPADALLVSDATHRLVSEFFRCEFFGSHLLKGLSQPVRVFQVVGETGARDRLQAAGPSALTPLVGRGRELAELAASWLEAVAGHGRLVVVRGEPGIGKSRLVKALFEQLGGEPHLRLDLAGVAQLANSAYQPVVAAIEGALAFAERPEAGRRWRRIRAALRAAGLPGAQAPRLVARLLDVPAPDGSAAASLPPVEVKRRTVALLVEWLSRLAQRRPVLVVAEDLHWFDPSTLELLELGATTISAARVLVLATSRPDLEPGRPGLAGVRVLELARLDRRQVEAMVDSLGAEAGLPPPVLGRIVERTDGVPLFVEELARMVAELAAPGESASEEPPAASLADAIPERLQDLLAARLDRLGRAKEVAQAAATIGREFSLELVASALARGRSEVARELERLQAAGVVVRRAEPAAARSPGALAAFGFRHALVQEAAYQSLLRRERRILHGRVADALAAAGEAAPETPPELLAHHFTEAGRAEQAIGYWLEAGERAVGRWANLEATRHLERGLGLLRDRPPTAARDRQELALLLVLGPAVIATRGFAPAEVEELYLRAGELCHQVGQARQLYAVVWGLTRVYANRARWGRARELAGELLGLAERMGEPELRLEAHRIMGSALYHGGDLERALDHLREAAGLFDQGGRPYEATLYLQPRVFCLFWLGYTQWLLGYPEQAEARCREALAFALEQGDPFGIGAARAALAVLHAYRRDAPAAREAAEACLAYAAEHRQPIWRTMGTLLRGWARVRTGEVEGGLAELRQGVGEWRSLGMALASALFLLLLAEGCGEAGKVEEGLTTLQEALRAVEESGERVYQAELLRQRGELLCLLAPPAVAQAEASIREALAVARGQGARSLELRALLSLARLEARLRREPSALEPLAETYARFSEGFESPDLVEAGRLLGLPAVDRGEGEACSRTEASEAARSSSRRLG
jgi:class 3 adenylate cyclase/predicted ATPase